MGCSISAASPTLGSTANWSVVTCSPNPIAGAGSLNISRTGPNAAFFRLEREDIEALSTALYKIPKATEKFAEHFIVGAQQLRDVDFTRQVGMLEQATDTVLGMVRQLRRIQELEKIKNLNERLQYIEGEAD